MANANIVSRMRGRRKIRNKSGEIRLAAVNYPPHSAILRIVHFSNRAFTVLCRYYATLLRRSRSLKRCTTRGDVVDLAERKSLYALSGF